LDAQIASQFLGTLIQVAGTILAVYVAIILYILQDKEVAQQSLHNKGFYITLIVTCSFFTLTIIACLSQLLNLSPGQSFDSQQADLDVASFLAGLILGLFGSMAVVIGIRKRSTRF
jgi:uncharacterized membrane protein YiaA